MGKTIRHKNDKYYKFGELVDSQYMPQNGSSKEYEKRGVYVPKSGGYAWHGHHPTADNGRIFSGILRAKMKEEINKEIDDSYEEVDC